MSHHESIMAAKNHLSHRQKRPQCGPVATASSGAVTAEVVNLAPVGNAKLRLECGSGEGELEAASAGGVQLFAPNQAIFLRTSSAGQDGATPSGAGTATAGGGL